MDITKLLNVQVELVDDKSIEIVSTGTIAFESMLVAADVDIDLFRHELKGKLRELAQMIAAALESNSEDEE